MPVWWILRHPLHPTRVLGGQHRENGVSLSPRQGRDYARWEFRHACGFSVSFTDVLPVPPVTEQD